MERRQPWVSPKMYSGCMENSILSSYVLSFQKRTLYSQDCLILRSHRISLELEESFSLHALLIKLKLVVYGQIGLHAEFHIYSYMYKPTRYLTCCYKVVPMLPVHGVSK